MFDKTPSQSGSSVAFQPLAFTTSAWNDVHYSIPSELERRLTRIEKILETLLRISMENGSKDIAEIIKEFPLDDTNRRG